MIGLGLITHDRPDLFAQAMKGICDHLLDIVDRIYVYNDGSKVSYAEEFRRLPSQITVIDQAENKGIARAKNELLERLMADGCNWLFLSEDDVVVRDKGAVLEYIATAERTGCHHVIFAHHRRDNHKGPVYSGPDYELYGGCGGAWVLYSRQAIETVGYMDENFHNAWEHVEHTHRIIKAGLAPPMWRFMDVVQSRRYVEDIPGSHGSSIRQDDKWKQDMLKGLETWRAKDPTDFPLQEYLEKLRQQVLPKSRATVP